MQMQTNAQARDLCSNVIRKQLEIPKTTNALKFFCVGQICRKQIFGAQDQTHLHFYDGDNCSRLD